MRRWNRRRTRYFDHCESARQLLGKAAENKHLDSGQVMEESLGLIDYDVWWCGRCRDALALRTTACSRCAHRVARAPPGAAPRRFMQQPMKRVVSNGSKNAVRIVHSTRVLIAPRPDSRPRRGTIQVPGTARPRVYHRAVRQAAARISAAAVLQAVGPAVRGESVCL